MIGSDAATTCVIVCIVVEGVSISLGHIDTGTPALLKFMLEDAETAGVGEVYLAGGFNDDDHQSRAIVRDILNFLHNSSSAKLHIRMAAVLSANTDCRESDNVNVPRRQSLAMRFGPNSEPFPAKFPDKGPMLALRSSRFLTNHEHITKSRCCWAGDGSKSYIIESWPFELDSRTEVMFCQLVPTLPDEAILRLWSTSPDAEGPEFCDLIRKV